MKKRTLVSSILGQRCPRCREGEMFQSGAYNLTSFTKMHKSCGSCGHTFESEPGFFMGAMYVSYAFQVAIVVTTFVAITILIEDAPVWLYLTTILAMAALLFPMIFRLSRSIWIHLFVEYKPDSFVPLHSKSP